MEIKKEQQGIVKILGVANPRGTTLVNLQLLSGNVGKDMVLEHQASGEKWRVLGLSRISASEWTKGIRGISVENLGKEDIREGMLLTVY